MKCLTDIIHFTLFCVLIAFCIFSSGDAGKTLKLPHYEVTFGSWPLMEVTKTGSLFGRGKGRGGKNIGGPKGSFRLGPPPVGNLLLVNPGDKGALHQHLESNLKHFGNNKPVNLNLPIIVKAPGPHPPPAPPGYKLGPSNGAKPDNAWKPGPPPGSEPNKNSRLFSVLKHAAFSGIFSTGFDTYRSPDLLQGPPFPGPYITNNPDGSQVTTFVNDGVMPGVGSGIELKPSVAPVIKIGDNLPDNYNILFAQRQVLGIKAPDTFGNSGNVSPGTAQYDVAMNLKGNYEQGYGAKPHPKPPVLIQTYQKAHSRGDHIPEKLVNQELPEVGLLSTTNVVFSTPNISAPLGGRNSILFKNGLADKQRILKYRTKEKPLDAQVKLLGRLFTKLQRLPPPKIAVPANEAGWRPGDNQDDEDGWKKVGKSKVDSPIMAVQIQTYSAPEINSADPDIVESMAEFGNHDVEFSETDELVHLMEAISHHGTSRVNMKDLGSNPQEINENLLNWVRRHLSMTRDINHEANARGEQLASNSFRQYQTFVTPPGGNNGWGPSNPEPVDPKRGAKSMSITHSAMAASMSA